MTIEQRIGGYEKLTSVFGYWPTFHDSEVLWLRLDRRPLGEGYGPTLEALIHAFEMTSDVDPSGFCILRHHSLVHIRFHDVVELRLGDFNNQNVLGELAIFDIRERQMESIQFEVHFVSSFGVDASFQCDRIELLQVTPCTRNATPLGDEVGRG